MAEEGFKYKLLIAGEEYLKDHIISLSIDRELFSGGFAIGQVCSGVLTVSIMPKENVTIPRMAEIKVYYQSPSSHNWTQKGIYYIDSRKKAGQRLDLTCYDKALMLEQRFLPEGAVPDFPMLAAEALSRICASLDITLDSRTTINSGYAIEYPEAMTMREVLGYIGAMHGGNWTFTDTGLLRLVVLQPGQPIITAGTGCKKAAESGQVVYSRVTMFYTDTEYFTSGDDSANELVVDNPWATQEQTDAVCAKLKTCSFVGMSVSGLPNHPELELGDMINVDGKSFYNCVQHDVLAQMYLSDMSFPMEQAIDHEYPYEGSYAKEIKQRVAIGAVYEGVSISRKDGLVIAKSDDKYRVQMKSDLLVFQRYNEETGSMEDSFYYDPAEGKFHIADNVIVDGSISSDAVITDSLYAENGDVAEMSVTTLQTFSQAWGYLAGDDSEVSYVNIKGKYLQFVIAGVTKVGGVAKTEQLKNIYDEPLYWASAYDDVVINRDANGKLLNAYPIDSEGKRVYTTTKETPYPVKTYVYSPSVKRQIGFEYNVDQNVDFPIDVFGAGSSLANKEAGKGKLFKDVNGFVMRYTTDSGEIVDVSLGNDGFVDARHRQPTRFDFSALNSGKFTVDLQGGITEEYTVEKDGQGRIVKVNETEVIW